jgi:hypothetical protein
MGFTKHYHEHVQPFLPDLIADRLEGKELRIDTLESRMFLPFDLLEVSLTRDGVDLDFWQGKHRVFSRGHRGQGPSTKFILSGMLPVSPGPRDPDEYILDWRPRP